MATLALRRRPAADAPGRYGNHVNSVPDCSLSGKFADEIVSETGSGGRNCGVLSLDATVSAVDCLGTNENYSGVSCAVLKDRSGVLRGCFATIGIRPDEFLPL